MTRGEFKDGGFGGICECFDSGAEEGGNVDILGDGWLISPGIWRTEIHDLALRPLGSRTERAVPLSDGKKTGTFMFEGSPAHQDTSYHD